jgi:cell division septation protein DedD
MRFSGAIAATMLAFLAVPASAQTVKDGVDAWQRGDYDAAVRAWRPLAASGDGDAAFDLAQAYKLGRGVSPDLQQAKTYYGQAARAGHVQGAANYGLLLFQDGDRKNALPWIIKASDAGDPRAQYVYGTALFNGDLAPKDWPRAYALMTRAAAAGLPQATTSLAQMDQFIPIADRQKGLTIASRLASRPVPPLGKALVTGGDSGTPHAAPVEVAAATPSPAPMTMPSRPTPPAASATHAAKPLPAPRPQPAPAAVPVVKAGGAWMIQLGAFGSEPAARTAWNGFAAKSAALRGLSPRYEKAGAVVRLRAAGLADRAAAGSACAAAKSAGAACFPVAP